MSDIVERLRAAAGHPYNQHGPQEWLGEAADEITKLRAEVERLRAALRGVLWMAEEWYEHGGNEDTLADDYKPALAKARAALGERT